MCYIKHCRQIIKKKTQQLTWAQHIVTPGLMSAQLRPFCNHVKEWWEADGGVFQTELDISLRLCAGGGKLLTQLDQITILSFSSYGHLSSTSCSHTNATPRDRDKPKSKCGLEKICKKWRTVFPFRSCVDSHQSSLPHKYWNISSMCLSWRL